MTPAIASPIDLADVRRCIEDLECRAREFELQAARSREAASTLRDLYGLSTLGPMGPAAAPPVTPTPAAAVAPPPADPVTGPRAWRGQTLVDQRTRQAQVLKAVASFGRPVRAGEVAEACAPTLEYSTVRMVLAALTADGRLTRTGLKSGARYTLPTGAAPAPVAAAPARAPVQPTAESAEVAKVRLDARKSSVAFFLLRDVLSAKTAVAIGDIVMAVYDKFGAAPYEEVKDILDEMVTEGACAHGRGEELSYRRVQAVPPAPTPAALRSTDVKPADGAAVIARALTSCLASGASYEMRELLRNLRPSVPSIDLPTLQPVLDQLVQDRRIERIPTGTTPRYRRRAA